jgi:hypothetical protein
MSKKRPLNPLLEKAADDVDSWRQGLIEAKGSQGSWRELADETGVPFQVLWRFAEKKSVPNAVHYHAILNFLNPDGGA